MGVTLILILIQIAFHSVYGDGSNIVGYVANNDVSEHLKIDIDLLNLQTATSSGNFTEAYRWYSIGGNSLKSTGTPRTIQGFSTSYAKLASEKWYNIFADYWNDQVYADTFTSSACLGNGDFVETITPLISKDARKQCCIKGAQYQNVLLYVIHELESAISDCKNGIIGGTHWDEAVAFYTGSIPAEDNTQIGYLLYGLAEKRCAEFGTCFADDDAAYSSEVNEKVFELFEQGRDYQIVSTSDACNKMETIKEALVVLFTIPLIQGTLKYLYFADILGTEGTRAELWAFASALLPIVDTQSKSASATLRTNALITNTDYVPDGYASVKKQLESVYAGLGVTCAQVGGLQTSTYTSGYYPGMEPCTDIATDNENTNNNNDDDDAFKKWGMALMISLLVFFAVITLVVIYYYRAKFYKYNNEHTTLHDSENVLQRMQESDSTIEMNKV